MITFFILIILSVFATGVMSYVSMATPIGPWIEPTVVLLSTILFNLLGKSLLKKSMNKNSDNIIFTVVGGSIGGILATALGFSLPGIFFLDSQLFNYWMSNPLVFSAMVTGLSLSASFFGFWIANIFEHKLIVEQKLAFPIGQLVHKMIAARNETGKTKELGFGYIITFIFCFLQDGFFGIGKLIPKMITIIKPLALGVIKIPAIRLDLFPIYWAIGFVTGHMIAVPLFIGALSKIFIVDVINSVFFPNLASTGFVLAFCSGMVLSGAVLGMLDAPKVIWNAIKSMFALVSSEKKSENSSGYLRSTVLPYIWNINKSITREEIFNVGFIVFVLVLNFSFFTYFDFSLSSQVYLMMFTFLCTYQVITIAGKIGLAQLGRFATFVMVPAIFLFKLSSMQIILIATFVEICCGVATDVLFGRKLARLSEVMSGKIKKYQLYGIIISSISVGLIFWLLINHFTLGSSELFAQKAQSRALLINAISFDHFVLAIGFVFGFVLKKININPMLVLGGLLMPLDISFGLIIGAVLALILKNMEKWEPFWSGVFASHSIWMILRSIL